MVERESKACWFAAGMLTGAITAGLCALLGSQRARRQQMAGQADTAPDDDVRPLRSVAASHETDGGSDMFEYRGFVVHLFWQALGPERYRAWCDIWEAGAVVQEAGGPPSTFLSAAEARLAAGAWARHWVQNNG